MIPKIDDDLPESLRRALQGSALRTPQGGRRLVRWMLVLLCITFLGQLAIFSGMSISAVGVYAVGLLLAALTSLPALSLIRYLDRRERESPWLFAGALLWGAVIGTGLAAVLNAFGYGLVVLTGALGSIDLQDIESASLMLTAIAVAPPVEELTKGLGVLLLFWLLRAEFDNLRDGMIYGGLIGLGFLIAEYSVYLVDAIENGSPPYLELLALRNVFFGLNYHTIWTALFGAGLGIARQTTSRSIRMLAPVAFYLLAVLFHGLNNSLGVVLISFLFWLSGANLGAEAPLTAMSLSSIWLSAALTNILVQFWAYAILAYLLVKSGREELQVIRRYLADEVGRSVTPEEYELIEGDTLFATRRLPGRDRRGKELVNAQNELAFRKWHLSREGQDPEVDPLVQAWRRDIARLRGTESED